jgi:hypothetical protein
MIAFRGGTMAMYNIYSGVFCSRTNKNCRFLDYRQPASYPERFSDSAARDTNPYGITAVEPNPLYLLPAVVGVAAGLVVGYGYFSHSLTDGYAKFIFFLNIYAIISSLATGSYILQVLNSNKGKRRFGIVIPTVLLMIAFFALLYNLTYTLYPFTFSGTIGDTPTTQVLSFIALSIGYISIGESFNISPERAEIQILAAIEALWNLFVLSLLISFFL